MDLTSSVVRYIMRNFRQPLSLEHIAKELGVSKYHLSHVFSARLHTSFREYGERPAAGTAPATCWLQRS